MKFSFRDTFFRPDLDTADPGFSYLLRKPNEVPRLPPERVVQARTVVKNQTDLISGATLDENRMYSILERMRAYGGPNKVISRFASTHRSQWTHSVWDALNGGQSFKLSSPLVQLFNPHSGRGYSLMKPNGTDRSDKTKDRWAEPFLEWLRYRGYFEGSAGWFASGDLRFYCPVPADISYDHFATVAAALRELNLGGTGVKMDCRVILSLTRLLIEHAANYRRPRQSLRGLWVTTYKDMGRVHTFMGAEQLSIPDWFELRSSEEAQLWLRALDEHETILRRLTDSHSSEFALLKQYRQIFQIDQEDAVAAFVEFLMGYGMHLFRRRAQDHWALPQFSIASNYPHTNRAC